MGKEDFTCDFCGDPISSADFEKGHAVVLLKKTYCGKCLADAVRRSKDAAGAKKHDSTPSATIGAPSGS